MANYNGFSFTNESSGDTLSNPDSFVNPSNGLDDNDGTTTDLSFTSTGTDTKSFGTTFTAKSIGACYVKVNTDLGANAASYVNDVYLQKYTGSTWVTLLKLKQSIAQTTEYVGIVSNIGSTQGLRVYFDMSSNSGDTVSLTVTDFLYAQSFTYTPKVLLEELGSGTNLEDLSDRTAIAEDHTATWKEMALYANSIKNLDLRFYTNVVAGAWGSGTGGDYSFITNTSGANSDEIEYEMYLLKGTYTLEVMHRTSHNAGTVDIDINGSEAASFDYYAASESYGNTQSQTSITVSTGGLKTITMRIDGKNASSSGFYTTTQGMIFRRTGD